MTPRAPGTALAVDVAQRLAGVAAHGLPRGAGAAAGMAGGPVDEPTWEAVLAGATRERLAGLLLAAATDGALDLSAKRLEQVRALHLTSMATTVRLERELLLAHGLLSGAGIGVRVLKGPAVARLDYADPALRPFADIDLLVGGEQVDAASDVLTGAGYRRRFPQPRPGFDRRFGKGSSFRTPDGHEIDLHRTLVMGPFGLSLRVEQLWGAGTPFEVGGVGMTALGADERLLHASFHVALGDVPPRLAPQRDVAEMLLFGAHDHERLVALAEGWQAGPVLASAIALTWRTLGLEPVSSHPLVTWAHDRGTTAPERRRLAAYARPGTSYAGKSFEAVRALPSWSDRAALLRALLLPSREYVRQRHHGRLTRLRHGLRQVHRSVLARRSP